jgi:hypothetical protein
VHSIWQLSTYVNAIFDENLRKTNDNFNCAQISSDLNTKLSFGATNLIPPIENPSIKVEISITGFNVNKKEMPLFELQYYLQILPQKVRYFTRLGYSKSKSPVNISLQDFFVLA